MPVLPFRPFDRPVCACANCQAGCTRQPGSLHPGDFERIAAHLGETPEAARAHFWASPGAVVGQLRGGIMVLHRIGTITPRLEAGRCVFLDAVNRCTVHPVAPFGCAYYSTHQTPADTQRRTRWHLAGIVASAAYGALRALLPAATSWRPSSY